MNKILVLEGYSRNSLAILRSLGSKGYQCNIVVRASSSKFYTKIRKLFRSKYAKTVYEVKVQGLSDKDVFLQILDIIKSNKHTCLIAGGTYFSNLISKYKNELSNYTKVLIESYDKLELVHDKLKCSLLAEECGIPIPKTFVVQSVEELRNVADKINGNAVIKLSDSHSSWGLAKYTGDKSNLITDYIEKYGFENADDNQPLIQEYIDGILFDTTAFAINGETIAILSQKRILTAWIDGGGGIVNITNDIPEIKEYAKTLIKKLNWTGHIEMDWIQDKKTKKCYLLEINPKIWGTTQLTISSGYDYPYWFVKHASKLDIKAPAEYKKKLMYRWLDAEIQTIFTKPKNFKVFLRETKNFIFRFFYFRCKYNIWWSDIKPFIIDTIEVFVVIFKSLILRKKKKRYTI